MNRYLVTIFTASLLVGCGGSGGSSSGSGGTVPGQTTSGQTNAQGDPLYGFGFRQYADYNASKDSGWTLEKWISNHQKELKRLAGPTDDSWHSRHGLKRDRWPNAPRVGSCNRNKPACRGQH